VEARLAERQEELRAAEAERAPPPWSASGYPADRSRNGVHPFRAKAHKSLRPKAFAGGAAPPRPVILHPPEELRRRGG